jgi:glutathione S-transferase
MPEDDPGEVPAPAQGLVLYGRHASPFVRRVAVTLRLYGIGYQHVPLMPFGPDKMELARFNPIARVPALQLEDGEMLVDSAVILDHLDQIAGPRRALTPAAGVRWREFAVKARLIRVRGCICDTGAVTFSLCPGGRHS